ncbi:MAG: DUF1638 domain-containing protein [Anaerolineales bacterium]|nr:DUF1638 domain-containing protein [Anaerolineales bacterium]
MRIKCIGCEALARLMYWCAAQSPHTIDVELLRYGLHNTPADLRAQLQARIDATDAAYDAIVLVYGLCGQASAGIRTRQTQLVIPRAHDCITLFLGSRARYQDEFENHPGTYWYAQDYLERRDSTGSSLVTGAGSAAELEKKYAEYVAKYGKENADYLMQVMGEWQKHYDRAAFIDFGVGDTSSAQRQAEENAAQRGWTFERVAGDLVLIRRLLNGDWENDFLIVESGQQIEMSYDNDVMRCASSGET